jgi:hypothetical protein
VDLNETRRGSSIELGEEKEGKLAEREKGN